MFVAISMTMLNKSESACKGYILYGPTGGARVERWGILEGKWALAGGVRGSRCLRGSSGQVLERVLHVDSVIQSHGAETPRCRRVARGLQGNVSGVRVWNRLGGLLRPLRRP